MRAWHPEYCCVCICNCFSIPCVVITVILARLIQSDRKKLQHRINGAGSRNRTNDLRITNALLYQLSYTGQVANITRLLVFPQPQYTIKITPAVQIIPHRTFILEDL